jgi:hypothetical protein
MAKAGKLKASKAGGSTSPLRLSPDELKRLKQTLGFLKDN